MFTNNSITVSSLKRIRTAFLLAVLLCFILPEISVAQSHTDKETIFTFFIPNAFSPNGDGINDEFYGKGDGIAQYNIWIFDRKGNLVFQGKDLNDRWNGKINGFIDDAPQDVYIYEVRLTDVFDKQHDYVGTVTLVK